MDITAHRFKYPPPPPQEPYEETVLGKLSSLPRFTKLRSHSTPGWKSNSAGSRS